MSTTPDLSKCFLATVWPSNIKNIKDIIKIIENDYKIIDKKLIIFDMDWSEMIRLIYKDDRVKEKNLLKKVMFNREYEKSIYLLFIEVNDPKYRYKKDRRKLSVSMEDLKKKLRNRYGGKMTKNNPIHIVDEQSHSVSLYNRLAGVVKC